MTLFLECAGFCAALALAVIVLPAVAWCLCKMRGIRCEAEDFGKGRGPDVLVERDDGPRA